jgi:hypothetical protein
MRDHADTIGDEISSEISDQTDDRVDDGMAEEVGGDAEAGRRTLDRGGGGRGR